MAEDRIYRRLQKHLDKMPVGFPATRSGVELRILKAIFTPGHAQIALYLTHRFESAASIKARAGDRLPDQARLQDLLHEMAGAGAVMEKVQDHEPHYALMPYVAGMFEFQVQRLTPELYADTLAYFRKAFGLEYLSAALPQTRIVPVSRSLRADLNVATYDEIRNLVEQAGKRIGVTTCICRKGRDLIGSPCQKTDRRELCIGFGDMFEMYHRHGWARRIDPKEAMEILAQSEKEGLVLQPSNEQVPQFVCCCCGCCCGILGIFQNIPRPADFAAANYVARIDAELCTGCGVCTRRCQVGAISLKAEGRAQIDLAKCIGCGVCVPTCKPGALELKRKPGETRPPRFTADLHETLRVNKKGKWGKLKTGIKIIIRQKI